MTSALDPAPKMRPACRRGSPRAVRRLQAGLLASLALLAGVCGAMAGVRGGPVLPDRPVLRVADRSSDPLANAGLRGRMPAPAMTERRSNADPYRPSGRYTPPSSDEGPVPMRAPGAPAARTAPAGQGGGTGLRERTETAPSPVPNVRAAVSNADADGLMSRRGEPVVIEAPVAAPLYVRPATGSAAGHATPLRPPVAPPVAAPVAPVAAPEPEVAPQPVAPVAAVAESPISATRQPNGAVALRWGNPDDFSRYVISVLGPDETTAMRTVRTTGPAWTYPAESQLTDFGTALTSRVCVRVRSVSDGASAIDVPATCIPIQPAS